MTFDPRARAAQIAKEASDQISGEWPLLMNDLERIVESALIRFAREVRKADLEAVDALIVPGNLSGNGCDDTAQRNGAILSYNTLFFRAKSLEDGHDA